MMKKSIYLFTITAAVLLSGCSNKDQMTNFIPTQAPQEDTSSATEEETESTSDTETAQEPETTYTGATTKMYVKLNEYGGYVNVRAAASKDGEVIGFLVHAEEIEVIEIKDGWASFLANGKINYVSSDFVVAERPDYLTPPPPTPTTAATPTPKPTLKPTPEDTPSEETTPEETAPVIDDEVKPDI
ncbi:MAG: SH3 domain-containing protein [Mobilitalea sp.]